MRMRPAILLVATVCVVLSGCETVSSDPPAAVPEITSLPRAKRYIDHVESYSTNEVAINWNAPLAWVAAWLSAQETK